MAAHTREDIRAIFEDLGMPDVVTKLFDVPPSYREHLGGADLACRHIAEKGTEVNSSVYFYTVADKYLALCPECSVGFEKRNAAKAGK